MEEFHDQDIDSDFLQFYQKNIAPKVNEYENNRIEALSTLKSICLITIPLVIALILGEIQLGIKLYPIYEKSPFYIGIIILITLTLTLSIIYSPVRKYKLTVKTMLFPIVFKYFGTGFSYKEKNPNFLEKLKSAIIIPHYTNSSTENYIRGSYQGVTIELSEAKLITGSGKNEFTIFKGMFILLSMNKKFHGETFIMNVKKSKNPVFNIWNINSSKNWLINNIIMSKTKSENIKLETIHLEDPIFEDRFTIFSTDQVEARYLLTTSFMERLLALDKVLDCKMLQCSFYNNQLLIMISFTRNRFEFSSIFKPVDFLKDSHTVLYQMREIFQILEILKLNQKTGL